MEIGIAIAVVGVVVAAVVGGWQIHLARKQVKFPRLSPTLEKKLVILIPKASTGFTKDLVYAIEREISNRLHQVRLNIRQGSREEYVGEMICHFVTAMAEHPDAILITPPPEKESLIPYIIEAMQNDIPVLTIDDSFDTDNFLDKGLLPPTNISCDHDRGGRLAAKLMTEALKGKGSIAIISGPKTSSSSQIRKSAFIDEILRISPYFIVISCKETNWTITEAEQRMNEIINSHDTIDGVFCCNDRLAIGALKSLKNYMINSDNRKLPIIVGHDGIKEVRNLIIDQEIFASVDQHMEIIGSLVTDELSAVLSDKHHYKHRIIIPPSPLTRAVILSSQEHRAEPYP